MNKVTLEQLLPVIEEMLAAGGEVTFTPNGNSMYPMLYHGIDTVTLKKPNGRLKKYDLPLYRRDDGKFILHRVMAVKKGGYITRGDNVLCKEHGITDKMVVGVVTAFTKNGKTIPVTNKKYRLYCILRNNDFTVALRKLKQKIKGRSK